MSGTNALSCSLQHNLGCSLHTLGLQAGPRTLRYGLLGSVRSVPAGFGIEVVASLSRGVREAMLAWGDALLTYYGKERERAWRVDPTLRYLGYATDNGTYCH